MSCNAIFLIVARFSGALSFLARLASSPNVTSSGVARAMPVKVVLYRPLPPDQTIETRGVALRFVSDILPRLSSLLVADDSCRLQPDQGLQPRPPGGNLLIHRACGQQDAAPADLEPAVVVLPLLADGDGSAGLEDAPNLHEEVLVVLLHRQ